MLIGEEWPLEVLEIGLVIIAVMVHIFEVQEFVLEQSLPYEVGIPSPW